MPQDLIFERWLDYPKRNRTVIFQREAPFPPIVPEKNVVIEWETPIVNINSNLNVSYRSADPVEYMKKYATTLVEPEKIPLFIRSIRPLNGERLATDQKKENIKLVGDVHALHLIKSKSKIIPTTNSSIIKNTPYNFFTLNTRQNFQRNSQNVSFSHYLSNYTQLQMNFFRSSFRYNCPYRSLC